MDLRVGDTFYWTTKKLNKLQAFVERIPLHQAKHNKLHGQWRKTADKSIKNTWQIPVPSLFDFRLLQRDLVQTSTIRFWTLIYNFSLIKWNILHENWQFL